MPAMPLRQMRLVLAAAAALALLPGCGSVDGLSHRIASSITPYQVEVVQGNFVSREQVEALQPGMSREQVRQILGSPLVSSLFHADRWDYVFTLKRKGAALQQRRLTVFFQGEGMARVEGDPMPSEAEFVATLDKTAPGKIPPLEATEEQLRAFRSKQPAAAAAAPAPAPAPAATPAVDYPPLEPGAR